MKVDNLRVKVTYEVGLGDLDIPDEELKQLMKAYENSKDIDGFGFDEFNEARDWLNDNIEESDCCEIEYELIEINQ